MTSTGCGEIGYSRHRKKRAQPPEVLWRLPRAAPEPKVCCAHLEPTQYLVVGRTRVPEVDVEESGLVLDAAPTWHLPTLERSETPRDTYGPVGVVNNCGPCLPAMLCAVRKAVKAKHGKYAGSEPGTRIQPYTATR